MPDPKDVEPSGFTKGIDKVRSEVLSAVLQEHDIFTAQRAKRVELLQGMEKHSEGHSRVGYLAFLCSESAGASIDSADIPAIGDALLSIGEVDQLNLIINGPGGDGTVAEKIIEICRSHCTEFRAAEDAMERANSSRGRTGSRLPPIMALCSLLCGVGANAQHLPIHEAMDKILVGRVKLDHGAVLPGLPAIDAICGGVAYPLGFTDAQGNFRVVLSSGGARFNSPTASDDYSGLNDCEFRARLPGFRSRRVARHWFGEVSNQGTISIGTILLSPPAKAWQPPAPIGLDSKTAATAYKKGAAAMAREQWNEAEAQFTKALSLAPDYYSAWIGIGEAREASQQWSEAGVAYGRALELNGKIAEPYIRIAQLGAKTGDWKKVAKYSEAALGVDARNLPDAYSLCALANFKLNRLDTAESSARAGVKLEAANEAPELWLTLGLVQAGEKRYANAAESLRMYLALVPAARTVKEVAMELSALEAALASGAASQAPPSNRDE